MAVGRGFFDQYSVFCVFGSVVGCVVVPLITQSVESVIFSAIVISLTATHLTKRATKSDNTTQVYAKELDKRNNRKIKDRESVNGQTKKKKSSNQQTIIRASSDGRRRRDDDELKKIEVEKQQEWNRKQEEKKEKKLKKKGERLKKKEHEKEEKEKEDQKLQRLKEERFRENHRLQDKISSSRTDSTKTRGSTSKSSSTKKSEHSSYRACSTYKAPISPVLTLSPTLTRELSQSEDTESNPPSPPPSVWKVPEYVEPKWNPAGAADAKSSKYSKTHKLNNDVICKKSKLTAPFNQLYNPVRNDQSFCKNQYMNQEKDISVVSMESAPVSYEVVKDLDKPDNRQAQQCDQSYSSFSGLPNLLVQLQHGQQEEPQVKSYSLFGPDQPNSSLFRSPLTGR